MFEWLFKFSRLNFSEGEIGFQVTPANLWFALFIVAALALGFIFIYSLATIYGSKKDKALSLGLRIPVLLLLALPLLEPVLITPDVVPDENFVAVLVDESASMSIPDGSNGTRFDDLRQILFDSDTPLSESLSANFKIRYYNFSDQTSRFTPVPLSPGAPEPLSPRTPDSPSTNLNQALERVVSDFRGLPLAGVVLLTDGGDNSDELAQNAAQNLKQENIPLHIVGLGQESFQQERELLTVTSSKAVEENTGAEIDLKVRSWMTETEPVKFNVFQGEQLVHSELKNLKGGGKIDQFSFFYEPQNVGVQNYRVEIETAAQEINKVNNSEDVLIDTRKDTIRVLYFEGNLRKDFKFIKRALEDDQVIEFASVSRTGTGKVYRQGIESSEQLSGGFPLTEAALHRYKAVILGDIEASSFSLEQLRLLENFVRVRGGGLLMLGGRVSLAEGDYWNTPIADLLPIEIDPGRRTIVPPRFSDPRSTDENQGFVFQPTAVGLENPILKFSPDTQINRSRWSSMPRLTSINYLGSPKPGALVLAEKPEDKYGPSEPLLAIQRYGKGRSAILATASTWRWQMQLPADDARHARFWRQLVRWLSASTPDRVNLDLDSRIYAPGEEVNLSVDLFSDTFKAIDGGDVSALLTKPDGSIERIDFQAELTEDGKYSKDILPQVNGLYKLSVVASKDGQTLLSTDQHFQIRPSNREYFDATLKRDYLESLAQTAGGFYYSADQVSNIPTNLSQRKTSTSIFTWEYLWDMPFLFGIILLLLSIEWISRRRKGLP